MSKAKIWGVVLAASLLSACLGNSEPEEILLTAYLDKPLSVDAKKERVASLYKRFLAPYGDKTLCDGKQFTPRIRIARADLEASPVYESGKLGVSSAGGADSFFGVPADAAKLRESAGAELEKWEFKQDLYLPPTGRSLEPLALIKRDAPNLIVVVTDNANARRETQDMIKADLGRDAPLVLGFSENPGDDLNRKVIDALCSQTKKDGKPTSVAIYFLSDAPIASSPPPTTVEIPTQGSAAETPAAPMPTPKAPAKPKAVAPLPPIGTVTPPVVVPPPVVIAPPPVVIEQQPSNAKEACFQERKHRTDTTSIGDSLCVTRKCNKDPRFKGSAFCNEWNNRSSAPASGG